LRKRLNELVRGLNEGIEAGVKGSWHNQKAMFVDLDGRMDGHRFCEFGHNIWDQYFGDKVHLWNMSPEGVVLASGSSGGADGGDNYEVRQPT
jgi:hypothetical protein